MPPTTAPLPWAPKVQRSHIVAAAAAVVVTVTSVALTTLGDLARPAELTGETTAGDRAPLGSDGAVPLGRATYPFPSGAIFVAPDGSDEGAGTEPQPLRTVAAAVDLADAGATIVVRGGTYHERFTVTKQLTIQNYPGEEVWFDGSQSVTGLVADGKTWRKDGWTAQFDSSASFKRGVDEGDFVSEEYPMAAHPDQVWVGGVAQRQVASRDAVRAGTFYVDYANNDLYLGTAPTKGEVRASTLGRAIEIRAEGTVLRGVGVRRYAPSLPDMAAVTVERAGSTVENLHLEDNSTVGISLLAEDITARRLTVQRNGLLGIHGNHADGLDIAQIHVADNNTERFNRAPSAGGIKITRSRDVALDRATVVGNEGSGVWFDESVQTGRISNSLVNDNVGHGVALEISGDILVVGNIIRDNGRFGVKINNTSDVELWNNTIVRNDRAVNIVQDDRRGSDPSTPGHDPRHRGALDWINGPVAVRNNVLSADRGNCLLCVEDYSDQYTAEQFMVTTNNNVYYRKNLASPEWVIVWSRGSDPPAVYGKLPTFRSDTGQEVSALALLGTEPVDADGRITSAVRAAAPRTAAPLPEMVAQVLGLSSGTRALGAPEAPKG